MIHIVHGQLFVIKYSYFQPEYYHFIQLRKKVMGHEIKVLMFRIYSNQNNQTETKFVEFINFRLLMKTYNRRNVSNVGWGVTLERMSYGYTCLDWFNLKRQATIHRMKQNKMERKNLIC